MKNASKTILFLITLLLIAPLAACSSDDNLDTFPAQLKAGASLDNAQSCDVDTTCPTGHSCAYVELVSGSTDSICVDDSTICSLLECSDGSECAILESYPAVVACVNIGEVPDGDQPVGS